MLVYLIESILEERVGILSNEVDSMFVGLNTKERESTVTFQEFVIFPLSAHLPRIPGAGAQVGGGAVLAFWSGQAQGKKGITAEGDRSLRLEVFKTVCSACSPHLQSGPGQDHSCSFGCLATISPVGSEPLSVSLP